MTTYTAVVSEPNGDVHASCGHRHRSAEAAEPCRERMLHHHPAVSIRPSTYVRPSRLQEATGATLYDLHVAAVAECLAEGAPETFVRQRAAAQGLPGDQLDAGIELGRSWTV